jgi:hypothetical protein
MIRQVVIGAMLGAAAAVFLADAADAQQRRATRDLANEKRVALIVGNSQYKFIGRLDNPKNDAQLMAQSLRAVGFTLVGGGPHLDLEKADFDRAIQDFGQILSQGADVALFFYAGHGLQVRGTNWLVPTAANPAREADVDFQMVDANLVLRQMEAAGTRLNLMILDACRNNPFGTRGFRSASNGLATMQAPEGTLIAYATQPGNVALDGADGNSPFTKALAQSVRQPGLDVFRFFNAVGLEVKRVTGGSQQPWVSSSPIDGEFYFAGAPAPGTVVTLPTAPAPAVDAEVVFWQSIASSSNAADYRAYLEAYPNGRFAALARARIGVPATPATPAPSQQVAIAPPPQAVAPAASRSIGRVVESYTQYGYVVIRVSGSVPNGPLYGRSASGELVPLKVEKTRGDLVSATLPRGGSLAVGAEVVAGN